MFPTILLLAGAAQAAGHELSVESIRIGSPDLAWQQQFDHRGRLGGLGLRVGYAPLERVQVFGSYQRTRRGVAHEVLNEGYDWETSEPTLTIPGADQGFVSAYYGHTAALGVRYDLALTPYFQPYAAAQGLLHVGTIRLDDDLEVEDNPNQLSSRAFAPGVALGLGGDLQLAPEEWPVRPNLRLEMGWAYTSSLDFGDLGELRFGGFYGRLAAGVTF